MSLKIVHCADLHIGAPCQGLRTQLASMRAGEIRDSLSLIANFCKEKDADALLICGDLFDTPNPSAADADFVREVLSSLSPTDVFIVCGNHDYMCAQSPFSRQDYFSENVHIFPCFEHSFHLEDKGAVIWGKSYSTASVTPSFSDCSFDDDKLNIMCLHGDVVLGSDYNIIKKEDLSALPCSYAAFGHIHNGEVFEINGIKCAYPGTPEGHKFNDDGTTGFIYAEISKEKTSLTPICLTKRKYRNIKLDVSFKTNEEIVLAAKEQLNQTDFFRLTLVGEVYGEKELSVEFIENELKDAAIYLEITDETSRGYNLDEIEKEEGLRGSFLRRLRESGCSEEEFVLAAKIGLDALSGRVPDMGGAL